VTDKTPAQAAMDRAQAAYDRARNLHTALRYVASTVTTDHPAGALVNPALGLADTDLHAARDAHSRTYAAAAQYPDDSTEQATALAELADLAEQAADRLAELTTLILPALTTPAGVDRDTAEATARTRLGQAAPHLPGTPAWP
jgi:hypothetical protein